MALQFSENSFLNVNLIEDNSNKREFPFEVTDLLFLNIKKGYLF